MNDIIEAYCTVCGKFTFFNYDGDDWVCQSCENVNTNAVKGESDTLFDQYKD